MTNTFQDPPVYLVYQPVRPRKRTVSGRPGPCVHHWSPSLIRRSTVADDAPHQLADGALARPLLAADQQGEVQLLGRPLDHRRQVVEHQPAVPLVGEHEAHVVVEPGGVARHRLDAGRPPEVVAVAARPLRGDIYSLS